MQRRDSDPNPSAIQLAETPPEQKKVSYVPPVIPMGLPHVVQYVTGSLLHMPGPFQLLADRMSRYANANGEVTIALEFLCKISDLGSKNTAKGYIDKLAAMDMLETIHGQGGNDRKSNTYRFLGDKRNWQPMPGEEPGTDPWLTLLEVRLENENLKQQVRDLTDTIELLTNGGTVGHLDVTYRHGPEEPDSYETTNPQGDVRAIGHARVTNGNGSDGPDSYGTPDPRGDVGAMGHSGVTNSAPSTASHSYEASDLASSPRENASIDLSGATDGPVARPDEGQEYMARRARVEDVVLRHRAYYRRSFSRRGLPGAVEYFSRTDEHEQELLRQVHILEAGEDPRQAGTGPPGQDEEPPDPDRYAFGYCPDCGKPFATYGGAEYCTDCTQRRRRESEA